jgi:hypothetical protein
MKIKVLLLTHLGGRAGMGKGRRKRHRQREQRREGDEKVRI